MKLRRPARALEERSDRDQRRREARLARHLADGLGWLDAEARAHAPPTGAGRPAPGRIPRTVGAVRRWRRDAAAIDPEAAADAVASLGSGRPIPARLRAELEAVLGADLGAVRLHTDDAAATAADALAARAFAIGVDIAFADGAYDPDSVEGRRLIAHEIAHTVQPSTATALTVGASDSAEERAADAFADRFVASDPRALAPAREPRRPAAPPPEPTTIRRWDQPGGARGLNQGPSRPSSGTTRYTVEGLRTLRPPGPNRYPDTAETVRDPSGGGRAVAVVPSRLARAAPFDVLVHFHGNNVGYRETSRPHHWQPAATVRDEELDRIEPQVEHSGRNLIAILPQGSTPSPGVLGLSQFGIADLDAFVREVLGRLPGLDARRLRRTIVSGHSGGGATALHHGGRGGTAGRLRPLLLFESINNDDEIRRVGQWIERSLATDLVELRRLPTPAARRHWLASHGAQLVATYNHERSYRLAYEGGPRPVMEGSGPNRHQRHDAQGRPLWDQIRGLATVRDAWFAAQRAVLLALGGGGPALHDALLAQYIIRRVGNRHDQILRGNLGRALDDVNGERIPAAP